MTKTSHRTPKRRSLWRWVGLIVTPAAVGGVFGFLGVQIADYFKERRLEQSRMRVGARIEEGKEVRALAARLAEREVKTPEEAEKQIALWKQLRDDYDTDEAKTKIQQRIDQLELVKIEFKIEEDKKRAQEQQLQAAAEAKQRQDAEAARRANVEAERLGQEAAAAHARALQRLRDVFVGSRYN